MKIIIGSDHAGFRTKEKIKRYLARKNVPYEDLGVFSEEKADYPDIAFAAARRVLGDKDSRGVLVCGTGTGMVIAANRVPGIRAAAAYDAYSARMSREDNDTNVLGLRGRKFSFCRIKRILKIWMNTPFSGAPRHRGRLEKIDAHTSKE